MSERSYALVTGASSGIGECLARALAARGHHLVIVARSAGKLEALRSEIQRLQQVTLEVLPCDLGVPGAATRVADSLRERGLSVSLLVNNAGFGAQGEFWKVPNQRQSEMIQINIGALVELTYLLVPAMIRARSGGIINVSSSASFQPVPYTALYAATKAFVTSFSLAIAEELRPYGVKVVTLCPGGTRTNFFNASNYTTRTFRGGLQEPPVVAALALRALDRGGGLVVCRRSDKLMLLSERLLPRRWVIHVAAAMFRPPGVKADP